MSDSKSHEQPVHVTLSVQDPGTEALTVQWTIENRGDDTVHVLSSERMPYLLPGPDSMLYLLQGVNPPDPMKDYHMIEIPTTVALKPGSSINGTRALLPLRFRDHYGDLDADTSISGEVGLRFQVGWGKTPILASERHKININIVLSWQTLAESETVHITLPADR